MQRVIQNDDFSTILPKAAAVVSSEKMKPYKMQGSNMVVYHKYLRKSESLVNLKVLAAIKGVGSISSHIYSSDIKIKEKTRSQSQHL